MVAVAQYAFINFESLAGRQFTAAHEWGLLAIALLGAIVWALATPAAGRRVALHLHSTQLFSGVLFILMGILLLNGTLARFNTLIPPDLAIWFAGIEDRLITLFNRGPG
jgi:hypothetical protein